MIAEEENTRWSLILDASAVEESAAEEPAVEETEKVTRAGSIRTKVEDSASGESEDTDSADVEPAKSTLQLLSRFLPPLPAAPAADASFDCLQERKCG